MVKVGVWGFKWRAGGWEGVVGGWKAAVACECGRCGGSQAVQLMDAVSVVSTLRRVCVSCA